MAKILICDDDPDIVAALKIYLAGEAYTLFEAHTGREAIDIVRNNDPEYKRPKLVWFNLILSVIIMVIVLFFSRGIMGDKELSFERMRSWVSGRIRRKEGAR